MSNAFLVQNSLKEGETLSSLLYTFASEFVTRKLQELRKDRNWIEHINSRSVSWWC